MGKQFNIARKECRQANKTRQSAPYFLCISLAILFAMALTYTNHGGIDQSVMSLNSGAEIVLTMLQLFFLIKTNPFIIEKVVKGSRSSLSPGYLMVLETTITIIYSFLSLWIFRITINHLPVGEALHEQFRSGSGRNQVLVMLYAILSQWIKTFESILANLRKQRMELSLLQTHYTSAQFETVKSDLNPNFLYSCLDALKNIINTEAQNADKFITRLSKTYRYFLDQRSKHRVPLANEIQFMENYLHLVNVQHHQAIKLSIQVNKYGNSTLITHTGKILMDYILDSCHYSTKEPLYIRVSNKANQITIAYKSTKGYQASTMSNAQMQELITIYKNQNQDISLIDPQDEHLPKQIVIHT
ncbi:histidine kinase [Flavihumibacter rivuli]|uniref:histidine kinase n=1 Tax=Flavihumibacter rivuli TaxID=2838156 RepID=UPI001BDE735C|nr:histidine kinase [Flavihumibacter rivuli]ULQ55197.1 histidine kinase [Flavihumibacter rivuli]